MPPKFATYPSSVPADTYPLYQYSKSAAANKNGALYKLKWQNSHGPHGTYSATHWRIRIGRNSGGGELYQTQTDIQNSGNNINQDVNVPSSALPVGETLWVTPKYKNGANSSWTDGSSTQFKVVA